VTQGGATVVNLDCAPRFGDREEARLKFRIALFQRRGLSEREAFDLADRLFERDAERDERRLCLECTQLQRDGGCRAAREGRVPDLAPTFHAGSLKTTLMRCLGFEWVLPT
jgi:hypothetical protein